MGALVTCADRDWDHLGNEELRTNSKIGEVNARNSGIIDATGYGQIWQRVAYNRAADITTSVAKTGSTEGKAAAFKADGEKVAGIEFTKAAKCHDIGATA